jgi:hydrogenase maturation protease
MEQTSRNVLVLGIGNILWADEGFGVRCIEAMHAAYAFTNGVELMDGGTQGLYLLPYVQAASRMIVFDAVDFGLVPGTHKVIENGDVPSFLGAKKMSLHQTGFQEVLATASMLKSLPEEMVLIGVQPVEIDDFGGSLRPEVLAKVPVAIELAMARLRRWGVTERPREQRAPDRLNDGSLEMKNYEAGRPPETEAFRLGDARFLNSVEPE